MAIRKKIAWFIFVSLPLFYIKLMKKIILFVTLLGLFAIVSVQAQKKHSSKSKSKTTAAASTNSTNASDTLLPYQKNLKFPVFRMLLMDSSTVYNTSTIPEGKPVLLFYFGAECDHCFRLLEKLLPGFDSLSDVRIIMATFSNPTPIRKFNERFNLSKYTNIQLGKDNDFFLGPFYGAKSVPCLVMYDRHKKFLRKWEDVAQLKGLTVTELYETAFYNTTKSKK